MPKTTNDAGNKLKVGFALAPDFTLIAFSGFLEALRHAADLGGRSRPIWCSWTVMSRDLEPVKASCGLEVRPWETFRDPAEFDYIVLVGGLLQSLPAVPEELRDYLLRVARDNVPIIGLCTASFILAKAGLLDGRRCCVHWCHYQDFRADNPSAIAVYDELFVEDGGIITSPGGTASIDLALYLVSRRFGAERAVKVLRRLILDWNRPMDHAQAPYLGDSQDLIDQRVCRASVLMERNISLPLSTGQLAREAGVSPRQLERLFTIHLRDSPAGYFRKLRLRRAYWLLHHTSLSITSIANECGFTDNSHFAKRHKEFFGASPSQGRESSLPSKGR